MSRTEATNIIRCSPSESYNACNRWCFTRQTRWTHKQRLQISLKRFAVNSFGYVYKLSTEVNLNRSSKESFAKKKFSTAGAHEACMQFGAPLNNTKQLTLAFCRFSREDLTGVPFLSFHMVGTAPGFNRIFNPESLGRTKQSFSKCTEHTTNRPLGEKFLRCVRTNFTHSARFCPEIGLLCRLTPFLE